MKDEKLKAVIVENFLNCEKAVNTMNKSLVVCNKLSVHTNDENEQNQFEALSSKFARATDMYLQKLVKSIMIYYEEDEKFFIDRMNKAEKLEIIDNAENLTDLRKHRNKIAHEYIVTDIQQHWQITLNFSNDLLRSFNFTKQFLQKKAIIDNL